MADVTRDIARAAHSMPIGSVIESPLNMERITAGAWLPLCGQYVPTSKVDSRIAQDRFGLPTYTVRTLAGTPGNAGVVITTPTYFVANNASGTTAMQYSTDGISWSTAGMTTTSGLTRGLLWAGSRIFRASSTSEGVQYTSGDNPGSYLSNVSGSYAAGYGGLVQMAYSPSLGRTVFPNGASNTNIYTVDDGGAVSVARTKTSSDVRAVCWTGRRFIALSLTSGLLHYSDDGITWTDAAAPFIAASDNPIASDGAGTVVIASLSGTYPFVVSKDHGETWCSVSMPAEIHSGGGASYAGTYSASRVEYSNGWFSVSPVGGGATFAFSKDGLVWDVLPYFQRQTVTTISSLIGSIARKGDTWVWVGINANSLSFTVDFSKFRLPFPIRTFNAANTVTMGSQWIQWIKVRE